MKAERFAFWVAVCVISLVGIWSVKLNIRVFSYFDWWFVVGIIIIGICFTALYINNKNGKSNGT